MYNIYAIVILILFDIPRISVNDLHQIQVAAPSPSPNVNSRTRGHKVTLVKDQYRLDIRKYSFLQRTIN